MTKRLDFEDALLHDIRRNRRKRPTVKLRWVLAFFAVGIALAASASALLTLFSGNSHAPLAETAAGFAARIAAGQMDAAVEFCAEGAMGSQLVATERARVFLPQALAIPQPSPNARADRLALLTRVRDDLARAGLDWENAQALAFGGVLAKVSDPARMQGTASMVVGNVYLSDGQGVYTIELSLMNCLGSYVITDIWQWGALEVAPDALKGHSRAQFETFRKDPADDGVTVKAPEHVFIKH
ncbi:MAG TPA: hypothetical protein PLB67_16725 [Candidatus Hydrogenedentes bacterium]|nr:hypothetical protein [Candidatus Hydrogenedentota bacterium]MDY0030987.1 hypothetical protein [FCB group bacterium]NLT62230.1 hypothetical protein [Candidatus Hydrogenedentota bacterium]HNV21491.1 hypothetical protein [Candidatus Hydrogenedentota bacterium]HNZ20385.1 hypothetical protein [Candidatus Hydrogenedentota bacterium]